MSEAGKSRTVLDDSALHVKIKLAALWASVMFCYIYADYFGLYVPGRLQDLMAGKSPLGPISQGFLVGTSVMMSIPSLMIFLSVALKPNLNRPLNIIFGVLFTVIILITMWDWAFYIYYGVVEIVLTGLVVWYAWNWPRREKQAGENLERSPGRA